MKDYAPRYSDTLSGMLTHSKLPIIRQILTKTLWLNMVKKFGRVNGMQIAGFMAFISTIAIVPILTTILGLMAIFPDYWKMDVLLQKFFIENLFPDQISKKTLEYLNIFLRKAHGVTLFSFAMLLAAALSALTVVEKSLNQVWEVSGAYPPIYRLVRYLLLFTVIPLAFGLSFWAMAQVVAPSAKLLSGFWAAKVVKGFLFDVLSLLFNVLAITLVYKILPHVRVSIKSALIGGFFAGIFLELAKVLFAYYTKFAGFQNLYGAFSLIPVFLLWLYFSWAILIMGGALASSLDEVNRESKLNE